MVLDLAGEVSLGVCDGSPLLGKEREEKLHLTVKNIYLVSVGISICFYFLINFKWSFLYFYNVHWETGFPLRPEVWS